MIVDPVEETFPFSGQAMLHDLEVGLSLRIGEAGVLAREPIVPRMAAHRGALRGFGPRAGAGR